MYRRCMGLTDVCMRNKLITESCGRPLKRSTIYLLYLFIYSTRVDNCIKEYIAMSFIHVQNAVPRRCSDRHRFKLYAAILKLCIIQRYRQIVSCVVQWTGLNIYSLLTIERCILQWKPRHYYEIWHDAQLSVSAVFTHFASEDFTWRSQYI